ncbi:MAG: ABC-type transport system involved in multi-copper enzyme maturation permease subunit [Limisphaerales bacterium]|jgi:ABC-type transport system involved in multi-copper enzyme maturation permease subunit
MWPIAKQTLKAAVRYRFVVAMAIALLVIVFGIPLLVKSDGTAKGTVQIVLTYTLGSTTALLGIASLWMGCGTLAREIEDNVMQMVAVKPIARWRVWLGKWLGIMLLNAALMAPTGLAIFFLINARADSAELNEFEKAKLKNEVLVSRSSIREPKRDFSISQQRAYRYALLVAEEKTSYTETEQALRMSVTGPEHILSFRKDYTRLIEQAETDPSAEILAKLHELERNAVRISKASYEIILPGQDRFWEFQIDPGIVDEVNQKPVYLRFKFNADDEYDPKSHTLWFSIGEGTNKRWPPEGTFKEMKRGSSAFHEEELPIGIVPDKGPEKGLVRVHFVNQNSERPIIFLMEDGPMILYHDGGFGMNLLRGLMIIFFWLGLISAIGLMASSFLSFPVATFLSLGILLISASTGTLEQIVKEGGITGINHETGRKDESSMLDSAAIFFAKGAVKITKSIWGYSPVDSLSDGRTITWATLFWAFFSIIVVMGGLVMALGAYMFHRKELALPNPTASMN